MATSPGELACMRCCGRSPTTQLMPKSLPAPAVSGPIRCARARRTQFGPSLTGPSMIANGPTTAPSPSCAAGSTMAVGWMRGADDIGDPFLGEDGTAGAPGAASAGEEVYAT